MEIGDRVTIMASPHVLNDGEIVGEASNGWRVWLPSLGVTRSYRQSDLALLTSRFTPKPPRRERDSERGRQQRIAGR